jgi:protein-S-isoprenylcysteine O-methyltransferase Ste14
MVASVAAVALAWIDPTSVSLGAGRSLGLAGVAGGIGLVAWTVLTYSRVGETLSPVVPPDHLVTAGPLARTRNPMYLGVVSTIVGVAVLGESPVAGAYAALLAFVYHVIGDEYRTYRERVPRWLPRRR